MKTIKSAPFGERIGREDDLVSVAERRLASSSSVAFEIASARKAGGRLRHRCGYKIAPY